MNPWKFFLRFLEGMSIATRFGLGIVLLLSLFVLVSATSYLAMEFVGEAQKSIQTSTEIQRLVLEMDRGMEKARRLRGGFFIRYPEIGLEKAHEQYMQPAISQIAQIITVGNALKNLIDQSKVSEPLRKARVELNLFLSSAKRFAETSIQSVELITELAAPETGLEVQLRDNFTALQVETLNVESLARLYGVMKSYTLDYLISRKRFMMQSAFNTAFRLRKAIDDFPAIDAVQSLRINTLIDRCIVTAHKTLDVDAALKAKFHDFSLQAEAVEAVLNNLGNLASEEVRQSLVSISHARRVAFILMAAITLTGLTAALLIARGLNNRITRRVVNLISSAKAFKEGNLDVLVREEGGDELSRLAYTFNVMAARIRKLIDNLELKVRERTKELSESERRFRELFENSSSGVAVFESVEDGQDFVFVDVNKAVETIEGVKRSELIGRKVTEAFPGVVELGLLEVLRGVWQTGQSARHPTNYYSDGRSEGWRENSVYKLPSGEIVAVYDDLTASKQAETERKIMEDKLQRAQKMESIGLLAGGVAHDLNNILSGIINYPELLLMQMPKDSEMRKLTQAIHESGQRAVAVVADLLTFARGVASAKGPASLNRLVKEYMGSPEHQKLQSLHADIDCITNLDPHLQNIHCSPVHIKKCIMNLVTNAMEAIDGSGRIVISTQNQHMDEKMALKKGISAGDYALLTVTDNGKGIPEKDLEHIFEPFYTKKVMGISGTGLGLAVVWSSVMDHEGMVQVESSAGGTSFILCFPVTEKAVKPKETNAGIEDLKGSGETVLVVDDELALLDIASRMLKVLGYDPVCVESGEKAVAYLQENRADMVLLDMLMDSGINGCQTYEHIIRIHPNQKAIIASGLSDSEDVKMAQRLGARGFIKKPYSFEELGSALKQELGR